MGPVALCPYGLPPPLGHAGVPMRRAGARSCPPPSRALAHPQLPRHTVPTSSGRLDVPRIGKVRQRRRVRREITPGPVSVGTVPPNPVVHRRHLAGKRRQLLPAPPQPQADRPGPTGSGGAVGVPRLEEDPTAVRTTRPRSARAQPHLRQSPLSPTQSPSIYRRVQSSGPTTATSHTQTAARRPTAGASGGPDR